MLSDLRLALRSLRATPAFTAVALVVLTLGISATTAFFSLVDAVVLKGLPFPQAGRLMAVGETQFASGSVAAPNFFDWRAGQHVFEDLAAYQSKNGLIVRDNGEPTSLRTYMVSASLFPMLRVSPTIGHAFTAAEEVDGRDRVALISSGLWQRRFGRDPNIVGRTLATEAGAWEIVGVMPEGFTFPIGLQNPTDLWVPYVPPKDEYPRGNGDNRNYNAQALGRLKDGVTIEQARAEMVQITAGMKVAFPNWFRDVKDEGVSVIPLQDAVVGKSRAWMLLLLGSVSFVLLIACVNIANLMLARATTRVRDVGVRAALGATRWQLARMFLVESLALSLTGTALGIAVAWWGLDILTASLPAALPRLADVAINLRVLTAASVAAILTGVLFGTLPAWQFSRPRLSDALREGGRSGSAGSTRQRARTALIVAEVALAVVLITGAGLFVSSFVRLVNVDLGIDTSQVITVGVYPRYPAKERNVAAMADLLTRIQAIPGVDAVTITGNVPLRGGYSRTRLTLPGQPPPESATSGPDIQTITADYFKVTRVPIAAGRAFTEADRDPGAAPVIMLNESAVRQFFGDRIPLGAIVECNGTRTVVGIVRDVRLGGPESPMRPSVYIPSDRSGLTGGTIMARTSREPALIAPALRTAIHASVPDLVIPTPATLDDLFQRMIAQRKFNAVVLGLFGALAIVIAAVGIYGVMAYLVAQRTAEIGVRIALGAQPGHVLRMVLGRAGALVGVGIAIGLSAGWALGRFVDAFLFQVRAHDPIVYAVGAAVLLLAGMLAAFVPARRAARVDPISVLR
jgi:predicted permease